MGGGHSFNRATYNLKECPPKAATPYSAILPLPR
jgi:hypothetical protein